MIFASIKRGPTLPQAVQCFYTRAVRAATDNSSLVRIRCMILLDPTTKLIRRIFNNNLDTATQSEVFRHAQQSQEKCGRQPN